MTRDKHDVINQVFWRFSGRFSEIFGKRFGTNSENFGDFFCFGKGRKMAEKHAKLDFAFQISSDTSVSEEKGVNCCKFYCFSNVLREKHIGFPLNIEIKCCLY